MARKSAAMDGNFAASSWTLPVSNVGGYHPRPLGARAKEPAAPPRQPRGMKRVAGDEELQVFPAAQVRADDDALGRADRRDSSGRADRCGCGGAGRVRLASR